MRSSPSRRFERLCNALVHAYSRACAGPAHRAHVDLRRAALIASVDMSVPDSWDILNHRNVARAFVQIALAAEAAVDTETMFGAVQLAKVWGFDWRAWLRGGEASGTVH